MKIVDVIYPICYIIVINNFELFLREGREILLITREVDYAIRILRSLSEGGKFTADELCERELLPKQFSYKILKKLQKAKLVEILRGAEGGFRLMIDLKNVTLYDFIRTMEADRLVGSCMEPDFPCEWRKKQGNCRVHDHLAKIQNEWDAKLAQVNLHQLIFENP